MSSAARCTPRSNCPCCPRKLSRHAVARPIHAWPRRVGMHRDSTDGPGREQGRRRLQVRGRGVAGFTFFGFGGCFGSAWGTFSECRSLQAHMKSHQPKPRCGAPLRGRPQLLEMPGAPVPVFRKRRAALKGYSNGCVELWGPIPEADFFVNALQGVQEQVRRWPCPSKSSPIAVAVCVDLHGHDVDWQMSIPDSCKPSGYGSDRSRSFVAHPAVKGSRVSQQLRSPEPGTIRPPVLSLLHLGAKGNEGNGGRVGMRFARNIDLVR